jgi:type I restriction enzyme ecoAI specificity protein
MVCEGGDVGRCAIWEENEREMYYQNALHRIRCEYGISNYFLQYALWYYKLNGTIDYLCKGVTIKHFTQTTMSKLAIPLPPSNEQKRIVDEIQRLFSIIDKVEERKDKLQLTIRQTKSKILDLAIHGKLVPQDPTDEPATELLKRINPKAEITCDNPQYENLPNGWCRCTLKDIGIFESGYAFSSDEYKQNGVPLVRISNITNNGNIDLSSCVYIQNYNNSKFIIHKGDLLIAMSGATTGKMGVYKYKADALLNQRVGNLKCTEAWLQQYRNYFMLAKSKYILNIAYGGAQPNISAKAILSIKIDLPPINEQHRIVAKIEELFTQLDNITSSI